jgi:hypothetical protein
VEETGLDPRGAALMEIDKVEALVDKVIEATLLAITQDKSRDEVIGAAQDATVAWFQLEGLTSNALGKLELEFGKIEALVDTVIKTVLLATEQGKSPDDAIIAGRRATVAWFGVESSAFSDNVNQHDNKLIAIDSIVNSIVDQIKKSQHVNLRAKGHERELERLNRAVESAIIELSRVVETEINLPFLTLDTSGPKHLFVKVSRVSSNEFEIAFPNQENPETRRMQRVFPDDLI